MAKTTKWHGIVRLAKTQNSLCICESDQSLLGSVRVVKDSRASICNQQRLWSECGNAQADMGLHCGHMSFCCGSNNKWAEAWKTNKMTCAPSLLRVFVVCLKKPWVLSYPLSAQQRLWSHWVNAPADLNHRWAHIILVGFVVLWLINKICLVLNTP